MLLGLPSDRLCNFPAHVLNALVCVLHVLHRELVQPLHLLTLLLCPHTQLLQPLVTCKQLVLGDLHLEVLYI